MAFFWSGFCKLREFLKPAPLITKKNRHVRFSPSTFVREEQRKELLEGSTSPFKNFVKSMRKLQQQVGPDGQILKLTDRDNRVIHKVATILWSCMDAENKQKYVDLALAVQQRRRKRLPPDPYKQQSKLPKRSKRPRKQHKLRCE